MRRNVWRTEEERYLMEHVKRYLQQGMTLREAFQKVGEAVNRTEKACNLRWYMYLRPRYKKELNGIAVRRGRRSDVNWTDELERTIAVMVYDHIGQGMNVNKAIKTAADSVGLSFMDVYGRWYNRIRKRYPEPPVTGRIDQARDVQDPADELQPSEPVVEEDTGADASDSQLDINTLDDLTVRARAIVRENDELREVNRGLRDTIKRLDDENKRLRRLVDELSKVLREVQ